MWGSDYPHHNGVWPGCQEAIQESLGRVGQQDTEKDHLRKRRQTLRIHQLIRIGGGALWTTACSIVTATS